MSRKVLFILVAFALVGTVTAAGLSPTAAPGPGQGYATDAYPGFDSEDSIITPSKKEPKWFAFLNGPHCDDAASQSAYCQRLELDGDFKKAVKQWDALVREWPQSAEAPLAQRRMAELLLTRLDNAEDAFAEFRYLIDFYSIRIDYNAMVDTLYRVAERMNKEGKEYLFFHFDNTVDVRRAYEACVMRAPGASWAPVALLTIAELREKEGKLEESVKVYENLRNLHAGSPEAAEAFYREALVRMRLLDDHGTNAVRLRDTVNFLKLALLNCELTRIDELKGLLAKTKGLLEEESFKAAAFYDSNSRTRSSAVNAYERYLADYPEGAHADQARARLSVLKESTK